MKRIRGLSSSRVENVKITDRMIFSAAVESSEISRKMKVYRVSKKHKYYYTKPGLALDNTDLNLT